MVLPGILRLGALCGVLGRLLRLGKLPLLILLAAFWALVKGYYIRQKASSQLIENAFRNFCGCALIAKKADDAALHIYQTKIQLK